MKEQRLVTLKYNNFRQIGLAIVIGILAGLIVSCFRLLIQKALNLVLLLFEFFHHQPIWFIPWAVLSVLMALFLGWLSQNYPDIKGSGIPQVEGQLMGEYEEAWWPVLWRKFLGGVFGIGAGLFLGREGPSIQLGATVGQGIVERRTLTPVERRIGIASGAAAGLSAAFNAPMASAMFILEEVYHNFSPLVWMSVFISALCSNFVSMQFFGLRPDLDVAHEAVLPAGQYWQLLLLGIVLGVMGRLYQYVVVRLGKWSRLVKWFKPQWYPVVPFLLVIPIAWYLPITLGGGNELIVNLTKLPVSVWFFLGLFVLRFVFSMISYGAEIPGGIFLPILTLGAVLGALYGAFMIRFMGLPQNLLPNFIIYAMAGYFACISKAPFTAILLITEMVGSLAHLMPLAVVSMVAYLVVDLLNGQPVYNEMLQNFLQHKKIMFKGMTQMTTSIYEGSRLVDKMIKEVEWPAGCLILSIWRGEEQIIPRGDTKLKVGDTLIVELTDQDQQVHKETINQWAHEMGS